MTVRIWLIGGPTASGKSALALRVADAVGGIVVNADALQIYRDLSILTARPSAAAMARRPHRLYGVADALETWSVGRWLRRAAPLAHAAVAGGPPVVFVGGTGLYFRALTRGLADMPPVPDTVRAAVREAWDAEGEPGARRRLAAGDPEAEARIARGDRQRLERALGVLEASGRALSDWRRDTRPVLAPGSWAGLKIEPDRAALHARCDARLEAMIAAGALEETARLIRRAPPADAPILAALGVREFAAHLAGRLDLAAALDAAKTRTRQYAKRQLTWFRNQTPDWPALSALEGEAQWTQAVRAHPQLDP